ncbi:MAG: carboxylesterase/lipase family protein [Myxococcales bacterium]|nr:carboxylesterase/lipase family protein [Myxococcales bacterium]
MADPIISTRAGDVRGIEHDGILAFKGLRYAEPPTGQRRFAPPAALEHWDDVYDASCLGPSCPQPEQRPAGWSHEAEEDEDCLRLNVWTPGGDQRRRPVMVWFHGGGYAIGSGSWPVYDGERLARRGDVVVVTVNHRLGPLGYLHLASLGGAEVATSGTVGMQDLVASLYWVRDNIEAFGGDPGNVMIFGESGGGAKVSTLLGMPVAKGLFHRAAIQSGAARYVLSPEQADQATRAYLERLGIAADGNALKALRALPVKQLIDASPGMGAGSGGSTRMGFSPVLDGEFILHHPAHALSRGHAADVPLLIGTNFDEASMWLGAEPALTDPSRMSHDELPARLANLGKRAAPLLAAYKKSRPDAPAIDLLLAINSDATMRIPSIKLAEKKLGGPGAAPVWMYLFCWAAGPLRSAHGFELPFMFDNVGKSEMRPSPSRQQLADRMSDAWLAFARGGDPNHDGLPPWPAYDLQARSTMIFDRDHCEVSDDPWGAERQAWFE